MNFREGGSTLQFNWEYLGNLTEGRPNLGPMVPVFMYRLMLYTLRDVMTRDFGKEKSNQILYDAGKSAGIAFTKNNLDIEKDFNSFLADLQSMLKIHKIGLLRVEKTDLENMNLTITMAEDLDCAGLPLVGEKVCYYDEGFLAGILEKYTGKGFLVKEVDCWGLGDRVCRFEARAI